MNHPHRHFPLLEDRPPLVPTWGFRVKRFLIATDISFTLFVTLGVIAICGLFLGAIFAMFR